jgi:hypothetical protein
MVERLTAAEATRQVIGLINSKPATPWPHEIEAIIGCLAHDKNTPIGAVSPALAIAFADWETVRDRHDAAGNLYGRTDEPRHKADADRWSEVFTEKSEALLALGAQSWADLQLLLPVVLYWNAPLMVKSPPYPHCTLERGGGDEGECLEARSTAYLVRALIDLLARAAVPPAARILQGRE